ncbi:hypothetical protein [Reyranella sp.]|uniref:hypothetical protein n=1 Tax=Reyranella sp. TaxID=1929291 RepID=UPI003D10989C
MPATNKSARIHGRFGDDSNSNTVGNDAGDDEAINTGLWNADNGLFSAAINPPSGAGDPPSAASFASIPTLNSGTAPSAHQAPDTSATAAVAAKGSDASASGSVPATAAVDPGAAKDHGVIPAPTSAGLHINLIADDNNVNAPAGWAAAIRQAADIIEQNFSDPVTINLRYGYASFRGTTNLADFGRTSDYSDFLNGGVQGSVDPFNEFYSSSTLHSLTTVDLRELDVIGFNRIDDSVQNPTTTGTVAVNGSSTGTINPAGEEDWFRVTLTAGTHYRFNQNGSPSGGGTMTDTLLRLYSSATTLVTSNDDSYTVNSDTPTFVHDSQFFFTPVSSGTYYLSAGGFGSNTGTYTVHVTIDQYASNVTTTGALSVGGSTTGNIEASGDRDWFRASLTAGQWYEFDLQGSPTGHGTLADTFLDLRNSAGIVITSDDDGGVGAESRIKYLPTSRGTYYLSARGFSSNTGTMRITQATGC